MTELVLEVNLHDPTDVGDIKAYCLMTELSIKLDTGNVCCVFTCWRSKQAYEQQCKPFAVLPVVLESDEFLRATIDKHAENLQNICRELVQLLSKPEKKSKIEQNARQNSTSS
jgi:hypothetical protein